MLYKLFREIVLFVNSKNVVHMATDIVANYVVSRGLMGKEFPILYWSLSASYCLNLMLQNIGKLDEVYDIINHASKITKYIYNSCFALQLMRKYTNGGEMLHPSLTHFATNFIISQSILA